MTLPAEAWDIFKLAFAVYLTYSLNRFNSRQRDQAKINKDLYEKYNALDGDFRELRGEHKTRTSHQGKCE